VRSANLHERLGTREAEVDQVSAGRWLSLEPLLSLRGVEDLLFERGIDICHETVRLWWNRFGPRFAAEIRRKRVQLMRSHTHWRWHLDEVFVRINGKQKYLWRAVDHEARSWSPTSPRPATRRPR
jgi:transposase-like protein